MKQIVGSSLKDLPNLKQALLRMPYPVYMHLWLLYITVSSPEILTTILATSDKMLALSCRDEAGEESLVVNFDTDLKSTFFAKLYQHSGLNGGHVIMLGADEDSRSIAPVSANSPSL